MVRLFLTRASAVDAFAPHMEFSARAGRAALARLASASTDRAARHALGNALRGRGAAANGPSLAQQRRHLHSTESIRVATSAVKERMGERKYHPDL